MRISLIDPRPPRGATICRIPSASYVRYKDILAWCYFISHLNVRFLRRIYAELKITKKVGPLFGCNSAVRNRPGGLCPHPVSNAPNQGIAARPKVPQYLQQRSHCAWLRGRQRRPLDASDCDECR